MHKVWTDVETSFITNNAGIITDAVGAAQLSNLTGRPVSVHAWRKQRQKLGIRKLPGRGVCKLAGEVQVVVPVAEAALTLVSETLPSEQVAVVDTVQVVAPEATQL